MGDHMSLDSVTPSNSVPEDVNVIIEIPANADHVKYEVDDDACPMAVDRFMATAMHYPCNYGYIPQTLCEDGDPADVLVITPHPVITGSVIRCRPIGVLAMTDESGGDAKILAVPISKLTTLYDDIKSIDDVPRLTLDQISHFFEHYKDLEKGKWVKIDGWSGVEAAHAEILAAVERYQQQG